MNDGFFAVRRKRSRPRGGAVPVRVAAAFAMVAAALVGAVETTGTAQAATSEPCDI